MYKSSGCFTMLALKPSWLRYVIGGARNLRPPFKDLQINELILQTLYLKATDEQFILGINIQ